MLQSRIFGFRMSAQMPAVLKFCEVLLSMSRQMPREYRPTTPYPQFWKRKSSKSRKFWPTPLMMRVWGVSHVSVHLTDTRVSAGRLFFLVFIILWLGFHCTARMSKNVEDTPMGNSEKERKHLSLAVRRKCRYCGSLMAGCLWGVLLKKTLWRLPQYYRITFLIQKILNSETHVAPKVSHKG
jgi:hypothetical protein